MGLLASLHPKDAATGLVVGLLVLGSSVLVAVITRRSRWDAGWGVAGAAVASCAALFPAVGRGVLRDVDAGAALAATAAAAVAGAGWHRLARHVSLRWLTVLVMTTAAGMWAAVPDTEAAITVVAALAPFALVALVRDDGITGRAALAAWAALAVGPAWAVAWGASAGEQALPGALTCFGAALVVPWLSMALRRDPDPRWLVPLHLVGVAAASRWAARVDTVAEGVVRSAVVLALLAVASAVSLRLAGPARLRPSDPAGRPR